MKKIAAYLTLTAALLTSTGCLHKRVHKEIVFPPNSAHKTLDLTVQGDFLVERGAENTLYQTAQLMAGNFTSEDLSGPMPGYSGIVERFYVSGTPKPISPEDMHEVMESADKNGDRVVTKNEAEAFNYNMARELAK